MTAGVDVHDSSEVCGSEIAKIDVAEEQCGFDMSSYNDIANGSSDHNGKSHCSDDSINKVNGIAKDDSDASYIFVNGNDAKEDDVVADDLGGKPIGDMSVVESEVSELMVEHLETPLDGELGDTDVEKVQNGEAEQLDINGEFKAIGHMSVESGVSELKVEHGETQLDGELGNTSVEKVQNGESEQPDINGEFKAIGYMSVESGVSELKVEHGEALFDSNLGDTGVEKVQNGEAEQPGINGEFKSTENVDGTGVSQVTHIESSACDCESTSLENGKVEIEAEEEEDHADNQIALKSSDESPRHCGRDGREITERESKSKSVQNEIECKKIEISIEEDVQNAPTLEKEQMVYSSEMALEGSSVVEVGGDDLQKEYVSALSPDAKTRFEAASDKVHVTIENADSLPASHEEGVLSESLDTCQNPDEPTGSSENVESLASHVMLGDAASSNDQVSTTVPDDNKSGLTNKVPIEGPSVDKEMDFDLSSKASSCPEVDATLETEVDKDSNGPISDELGDSLPTGLEQGSIPEGPSGDKEMDFELSLKSSSCPEVDAKLDTEIEKESDGPISDELGDSLPTGLEQGSIPEGPSGDKEMDVEPSSKSSSCSEVDAKLDTEVEKESNGPISDESGNSLPTGLEQGSIPEGPSGDKEMDFELSLKSSSCPEVDAKLDTEAEKESDGPISDELGDILPTGLEQGSIPEGPSGDKEMDVEPSSKSSSCSEVDAKPDTEVEKESNGPISDESGGSLPTGLEQGSIPEGPSGDKELDVEPSSKSSSCSEVDAKLDTEVEKESDGPISDESGHSLPTGFEQGSIPEGPSGDKELDVEPSSKSSSCSEVDAKLDTEVEKESDGPICDESGHSLPTGLEQGSIPEGPSGDKEMDFEPSSKSFPRSEVDATVESEVDKGSNGPISDETRDSIPTVLKQGSNPETVAEQNVCTEKYESLTSSSAYDTFTAENGQNAPTALINCRMTKSDVGDVVSLSAENLSTCKVEDMIAEADIGKSVEECNENPEACLIDCKKVAVEAENGPVSNDNIQTCPVGDEKSESKACLVSLEDVEDEVHVSSDAMDGDSSISNVATEYAGHHDTSGAHADVEIDIIPSVEDEHNTSACVDAVQQESEVDHTSAVSGDILDNDIAPESSILNSDRLDTGSAVDRELNAERNKGSRSSPEGVVHVESSVKLNCQGAEDVDEIDKDETSKSYPENAVEGENMSSEVVKRALCFLIRMPRYDDENIREQIRQAQVQVEEKTKIRDDIRVKIQRKRETCKDYDDIFQGAASKERAARDLLKSKRQEMDSIQFMINKVKNAMSVEDLDGQIRSMEHMIEHETLPLKKEKELIRDINKLKQTRELISSNMGKQDEVQQAVDQKDQIEERLKSLRKDMDLLRDNLLKAEEVTQAAKKKLNVEKDELNELFSKFKAADGIRQEAYVHLQSLKKRLYEKNKCFWKYKEDAKTAYDLALSGDREELQRLCAEQVETTMELWNKNDDFRKEYIRCNTRSTLRRLRTLDGRSLGPDEEPPVIPNIGNERFNKNNSAARISTSAQEKEIIPEVEKSVDKLSEKMLEKKNQTAKAQISTPVQEKEVILPEVENSVGKFADKMVEKKNQTAKAKTPAKVASSINDSANLSSRDDIGEEKEEEHKRTKEKEELARKAEEQRKEEAAARLKEQRKLEEKAKAKEALERKKRIAEKAQARAAIRAQKEAEEKERERERRAKKKEKKGNATARDATTDVGEGESIRSPSEEIPSGTPKDSESEEKPTTVARRTQKTSQFTKHSKSKSIPPPLRNRGKRRIQPWMWVLLTVVVVFALFLVGNANFSFKSTLQEFGF